MEIESNVHDSVIQELKSKFKDYHYEVLIPPPVFIKMNGTVASYDKNQKVLKIIYPILEDYLNPFGSMQGGMIAAAIDNTLGPLSMLVAPLNYTRQLDIKFRKTVKIGMGNIMVVAKYVKSTNRLLEFTALVVDENANKLASAKAIHWVIGEIT